MQDGCYFQVHLIYFSIHKYALFNLVILVCLGFVIQILIKP